MASRLLQTTLRASGSAASVLRTPRQPLITPSMARYSSSTQPLRTSTSKTNQTQKSESRESKESIMDRNALDPRRSEGTGSSTDDDAAMSATAFDPSVTSPESERQQTSGYKNDQDGTGDPLEASGANREFSSAVDERDHPEADPDLLKKKSGSGGGESKKHGKVWTSHWTHK